MTANEFIRYQQRDWARRHNRRFSESGYVDDLTENLYEPLTESTRQQFQDADGHELRSREANRPKMQALHSSSALAVNVFQYWQNRDKTQLAKALRIPSPHISSLQFEKRSPISSTVNRSNFPIPPNIDVVLEYAGGSIKEVGIESKFSEAYGRHEGLRDAYLADETLWVGLPECRKFAERVRGPKGTKGVDFSQLLKHVLGLKHRCGLGRFWLVYLWYAAPTPDLGEHFEQLEEFKSVLLKDRIRFHYLTYQELICRMTKSLSHEHQDYVHYLSDRYL